MGHDETAEREPKKGSLKPSFLVMGVLYCSRKCAVEAQGMLAETRGYDLPVGAYDQKRFGAFCLTCEEPYSEF